MSKATTPNTLSSLASLAAGLTALPALAATGMDHSGMDWFAALDHYCERVAVGLWDEPFNATSNLAFLVAAGVILVRQRRVAWADKPLAILAAVAASAQAPGRARLMYSSTKSIPLAMA